MANELVSPLCPAAHGQHKPNVWTYLLRRIFKSTYVVKRERGESDFLVFQLIKKRRVKTPGPPDSWNILSLWPVEAGVIISSGSLQILDLCEQSEKLK